MTTIADKLQTVRARIDAACRQCGRDPASIRLLAVSKTFGPEAVREAWAAGQPAFGENYVQEAVEKIQALQDLPIEWHCIGPLQSNKTRLVAAHFHWVHSVDRLAIAQRLSLQRPATLPPLQICLQVNVDGGQTKSGVAPESAAQLAHAIKSLSGIRLRGLMTIPEPSDDFTRMLAVHQRTRALFDQLNAQGFALDTLSMGMSADLEAAVQAGSTLVRVGTALFGERAVPA
jgi:pyridoxal phosphate enzyme (YggS family)